MSTATVNGGPNTTYTLDTNVSRVKAMRRSPTLLQLYWNLDQALQTKIRLYVMSYGRQITQSIKELVAAENKKDTQIQLKVGEDTTISLWSAKVINAEAYLANFQLCISTSWKSMVMKNELEIALYLCKLKNLEKKEAAAEANANAAIQEEEEDIVRTRTFFEHQLFYFVSLQKIYFRQHMIVLEKTELQSPIPKLMAASKTWRQNLEE